ncbi:hypothetical protein MMSR116_21115 [Methylobacterium mesophilicum SR1.6/6]|uniref:Porin n=1 Tax=Methylobacterium mesophilicum SR1.6/6 TaxID=908290 RepID=A0A6B9FNF2_9HYPH|nr:hypothetical protein MMSR116_21115 [Methylobacterium mesophilicum SR1.6/6]
MRVPVLRIVPVLIALAGPAAADRLSAGTAEAGCGGDASSSAEVIEHRPPRRGPLTANADTLCADLAPQPGTPTTQIDIYPMITPQVGPGGFGPGSVGPGGVGPGGGGIPYGGRPIRPYRP